MKKFFGTLLVLLILAGLGLYFGWAQAKVPPGSFGILRSKTHGTASEVIRTGEFRWIWYKLIPTNTKTLVLSPRRVAHSLNASGTLPSGRQYAFLAGIDADFNWRLSGEFSFSIRPESLPFLTEKENLADEAAFRALENRYAANIEAFIQQSLRKMGEDEFSLERLLLSHSLLNIPEQIEAAFPEIENFDCFVSTVNSPDFNLYRAAKALNDDYLSQFHLVMSNTAPNQAENRINQRLRIDELTMIGELLTQFPILLDYLKLMENPAGAP